jgi:hypothetical protein
MTRIIAYVIALSAVTLSPAIAETPYSQVRGIIHLDTSVSGGEYEPEEMVRYLRDNDFEIAVLTDQITTRLDYGVFPSRWATGKVTGWLIANAFGRTGSVLSYGPSRYLSMVNDLDRKYGDITVLPGVEGFPFFYWEGNPLTGLSLVNGYRHLLAFGMGAAEDYQHIPTIETGFDYGFSIQSILSLWPLVLVFFGIRCVRAARTSKASVVYRFAAGLFFVVGGLFLIYNFPFRFGRFDQYHGDQGAAPYQAFIDHVTGRGGVVFWAHPEVAVDRTIQKGPVTARILTEPYHELLLQTHGYTGFAAFYEGVKYVVPPGGIWDQVLGQYCRGERERPVWAITEGDVEGDQFSPKLTQTVFLLDDRSPDAVIDALKNGRMYALAGQVSDRAELTDFLVSNGNEIARSGDELKNVDGQVQISARITCDESPRGNAVKADLIRDGEVVGTYKANGDLSIAFTDTLKAGSEMTYYRLDAWMPGQTRLISNPIFVRSAEIR